MGPRLLVLYVCGVSGAVPFDPSSTRFVPLQIAGLGRYGTQPALFLQADAGGLVMPVPIPRESEAALEQALAPTRASRVEVLLQARPLTSRDDGLLDSLPWSWNPNPLAKRDCFARLSGRDYPNGANGPGSAYELLVDAVRSEACAEIRRVCVVNEAAAEENTLSIGSCVLLQRRLPDATRASDARVRDAGQQLRGLDVADAYDEAAGEIPCACAVDEALGLALALGLTSVDVEESVWENGAREPKYAMLRSQMRICIPEEDEAAKESDRDGLIRSVEKAKSRPKGRAPWEYTSADELLAAPPEDKAISALVAGLRLPRVERLRSSISAAGEPNEQVDAILTALLEPLCDESVRRELRARRALAQGEAPRASSVSNVYVAADPELFNLETQLEACSKLKRKMAIALAEEDYETAAELQAQLLAEQDYLDELLEEMPEKRAFTTSAASAAAAAVEEAESPYASDGGDGDSPLEDFYEQSSSDEGDEWFESIRRVERDRQLALSFASDFIETFRGQLPVLELLAQLEEEEERYRRKEATLSDAAAEERAERRRETDATGAKAEAYYAAEAEYARMEAGEAMDDADEPPMGVAWDDDMAPRVARQLIFALSDISGVVVPSLSPTESANDWLVRQGVARLDALLEAAGRGDLASAMTLRRLAALTASLEELQERRRGGAAGSQTALEEERKALVGQVCACVLQEEEEESAP